MTEDTVHTTKPAPTPVARTPRWSKIVLFISGVIVVIWAVVIVVAGAKIYERFFTTPEAAKPYIQLVEQVQMPNSWKADPVGFDGFGKSSCGTCVIPPSVYRTWEIPAGVSVTDVEKTVDNTVHRNLSWTDNNGTATATTDSPLGVLTYDIYSKPNGTTGLTLTWGK